MPRSTRRSRRRFPRPPPAPESQPSHQQRRFRHVLVFQIDEAEGYDKRDSVTVEGSGHFGGGSSGAVQSFIVVKFNQAQMPDVPAASGG